MCCACPKKSLESDGCVTAEQDSGVSGCFYSRGTGVVNEFLCQDGCHARNTSGQIFIGMMVRMTLVSGPAWIGAVAVFALTVPSLLCIAGVLWGVSLLVLVLWRVPFG